MKYNTLKFNLDEEEQIYILTDVISYHTMWQDYYINPIPDNEYAEHGVKEYSLRDVSKGDNCNFVVCNDIKGMDWYINEIAIPYEADVSKYKQIITKVLQADDTVSKNDLKELFG